MASRFPLQVLVVSTIFLLIGICISLPYRRDTVNKLDNCDKYVRHVVVINSTDGTILNCHKCHECPKGTGLSIPCNGQNVTQSVNIECVKCVSGVNYSTGETVQCQPCLTKKCKDWEKVEGKCADTGDNRTCQRCELKDWYYNHTQKICLPCVCHNMTAEIKQICTGLGFDAGINCKTKTTNMPYSPKHDTREVWKTKYTMIIIVVCGIMVLLAVYCYCVTTRAKKLKIEHPRLSVCSKEWFCPIFFFKAATRSRPPSYSVDDRHAHSNGNGCAERIVFLRQSSCPVTQNEKYVVNNSPHASLKHGDSQENVKLILPAAGCKQKKLKFFDMNSETCRKILQALKQNVDTGMGYPTLAGYMDFSANKVKTFEEDDNPCKSMLECWSSLDNTENNVLKLKDLVVKLERDDILTLLKLELQKAKDECDCSECVVVKL